MYKLKSGKELNGEETIPRIIRALITLNKPSRLSEIAKQSNMSKERIHNRLNSLIKKGILLKEECKGKKFYYPQPFFKERGILFGFYERVLPFVNEISEDLDISQMKVSYSESVLENILLALKLFSFEIKELKDDIEIE
ncbi:hypothetical protein LCGC14_0618970 [marine sediment metagenome]|uniref:Uncharacterized protein n=1 Tax=marine sediment metagenome TaxID=412755 RepID=A0A0F9RPR4_9ZZZZ